MKIPKMIKSSQEEVTDCSLGVGEPDQICPSTIGPSRIPKENNPMKIDLILEIIFGYCPVSTLRNCRLVCRLWRDASLKFWRPNVTLQLSKKWCLTEQGSFSVKDYLLHFISTDNRHSLLPAHLQCSLENTSLPYPQKFPFRNFRIDSSILEYLNLEAEPITDIARHVVLNRIKQGFRRFVDFLSSLPSLESLEVRNCEWRWKRSRVQIIASQSLKRLKIYQHGPQLNTYHVPQRYFFEWFQNIEALCLEYRRNGSSMGEILRILKIVKSIRIEGGTVKPFNLNELEIINFPPVNVSSQWWQRYDKDLIDTIYECKFSLTRLVLDLKFSENLRMTHEIRSICRLLHSCSESLQVLALTLAFDVETFVNRLVEQWPEEDFKVKLRRSLKPNWGMVITMNSLKEVKLANGLWGLFLLTHLELPNVKNLVVEYKKGEGRVKIQDYQVELLKGKVFPTLQTFELLNSYEIPEPETVRVFTNIMPNLRALSLPLDKEAFQMVCGTFPKLRIFHILSAKCPHSLLDDETFTGVSKDGGGDDGEEEVSRRPSIRDLSELTHLTISRDVAFTEHSIIHGFLKLPRLYYLSAAFKQVSDEMKAKLLSHVKGAVVILEEQIMSISLIGDECDDEESEFEDGFTSDNSVSSETYVYTESSDSDAD